MPVESIVNVSISLSSAGFPRTGYGKAGILSATTLFTERSREFSSTTEMTTLGFSATGPEVLAAGAALAQTPRPRTVKVLRLANRPTMTIDLTPIAANSTVYSFDLNGLTVSITSDGSATVAEIVAALKTAVDAKAISGLTATDNTTKLTLTMTIGLWLRLYVSPEMTSRLTVLHQTTDPGVAADLAAIAVADNDWYWLINPFPSKAMHTACATYAEANGKLFEFATQDSAVINTSVSGTDDVAEALAADLRARLVYHPDNGAFMDAAEMGRIAPTNPGSASFSDKNLAGVAVYELTSTQRANATAKNVGIYERIGADGRTRNGKTLGGEWADKIIARDALVTNIQAAVYTVVSDGDKLPFTDEGISAIQGAIKGELDRAVANGVLAADPAPVVHVPLASEVSDADKAARTLTGVTFDAILAGAIVAATINGTLAD